MRGVGPAFAIHRWPRGAAWGVVVTGVATAIAVSCAVDTELGLALEVSSARVAVTGAGTSAVIALDASATVRVGEHAQGTRMFVVPRADLLVAGAPVATINLDRPAGFDGTLAPGDSRALALHGQTIAGAFDPGPLCATPTPTVQIVLHWEDRTAMEVSSSSASTMTVTCP